MLEGLEQFFSSGGGTASAGALLAFAVFLLLTGRLVSKSSALEMRKPYEAMAEQWKTAHDDLLAVHRAQTEQVNELLELARTTARVIGALPLPLEGPTRRGAEEGKQT